MLSFCYHKFGKFSSVHSILIFCLVYPRCYFVGLVSTESVDYVVNGNKSRQSLANITVSPGFFALL